MSVVLRDDVVKTPGFPESVAQGDLKWLKKVGDAVRVDEVVAEIETDKTMIPVPSPLNGTISELLAADGAKVAGHQPIFKVKAGEGAPAAAASQPQAAAAPAPAAEQKPAQTAAAPAQPQASGGALRRPPPPAAAGAAAAPAAASAPPASAPAAPRPAPVAAAKQITPGVERIVGTRGEHRVRMSRLRMRIAERLKDAQNTCALLTTFNEVDMSSVLEMRKRYGDAFQKKHGIKLGIMGPFVKAAAYALDQMPIVNAVIDQQEIVYRDYIDISVAVSAPRGLVVPVIRGVENMNYVDVERAIAVLSEKARKETLTLEEMEGGTFTVSNGGVFGSLISTPIVNPPQSAILGMHATFDRPVAINGKVEIRPMMYITMTYDHRLIDGREAVTFLRTIKTAVEDPRVLQLDL